MKSLATEYKTTRTHTRGRHVPSDDQLEREEHWEGLDDGDASNPMTTTHTTTTATTGEKTAAAAAVEVCFAMPWHSPTVTVSFMHLQSILMTPYKWPQQGYVRKLPVTWS